MILEADRTTNGSHPSGFRVVGAAARAKHGRMGDDSRLRRAAGGVVRYGKPVNTATKPRGSGTRSPRILGIATLAALAILGALFALSGRSEESPGTAPVDASFTYFDGTQGKLSDFRGTPLVVNFWASWCPPCVAEMPDIEKVHQELGDRVAFLGLNMQEVDRRAASNLAERAGVTYALGEDPDGSIFRMFGGIAMPTTVLIDPEGRVVRVHGGVLTAEDLRRLIETRLLG